MQFQLRDRQLTRLADLCFDIAKGNLLGAILAPAITSVNDVYIVTRAVIVGLIFIYLGLRIEGRRK